MKSIIMLKLHMRLPINHSIGLKTTKQSCDTWNLCSIRQNGIIIKRLQPHYDKTWKRRTQLVNRFQLFLVSAVSQAQMAMYWFCQSAIILHVHQTAPTAVRPMRSCLKYNTVPFMMQEMKPPNRPLITLNYTQLKANTDNIYSSNNGSLEQTVKSHSSW